MVRICLCMVLMLSNVFAISHSSDAIMSEDELLELTAKAGQPFCWQACFPSEVSAHLAASQHLLAAALNFSREVSWRVYRMDDATFTYSYPAVGKFEATQSDMPPLVREFDYVSSGHIHWDDVHDFSAQDWNWVIGNRKPLFLMSREGILRRALPQRVRRLARSGGLATRPAVAFRGERVALLERPIAATVSSSIQTKARP